ncbi:MAG: hypothetical protein PVSMB6_17630 [Steroidobacteraceae bacterium]
MTAASPDPRAQAALLELQRTRAELLAALNPSSTRGPGEFPRSATIRWLLTHVTARSLATTALTAAVLRPPWIQLIGRLIFNTNRRRV